MASTKFAPRSIAGSTVLTKDIVHTSGNVYEVKVEDFAGTGFNGFMFTIYVNGKAYTNYRLYATIQKAINAAAKISW